MGCLQAQKMDHKELQDQMARLLATPQKIIRQDRVNRLTANTKSHKVNWLEEGRRDTHEGHPSVAESRKIKGWHTWRLGLDLCDESVDWMLLLLVEMVSPSSYCHKGKDGWVLSLTKHWMTCDDKTIWHSTTQPCGTDNCEDLKFWNIQIPYKLILVFPKLNILKYIIFYNWKLL